MSEFANFQIEKQNLIVKLDQFNKELAKLETKKNMVIEVFGEGCEMLKAIHKEQEALEMKADKLCLLQDAMDAWETVIQVEVC